MRETKIALIGLRIFLFFSSGKLVLFAWMDAD